MKKQQFFEDLQQQLGLASKLTADTDILELDDFDSMAVLSLITYLYRKFGARLSTEEMDGLRTPNDLVLLIGEDKFED